jgi:hypothetical protein
LRREGGEEKERGLCPLSKRLFLKGWLRRVKERRNLSSNSFPLSFKGEGDKGGEVNKRSLLSRLDNQEARG